MKFALILKSSRFVGSIALTALLALPVLAPGSSWASRGAYKALGGASSMRSRSPSPNVSSSSSRSPTSSTGESQTSSRSSGLTPKQEAHNARIDKKFEKERNTTRKLMSGPGYTDAQRTAALARIDKKQSELGQHTDGTVGSVMTRTSLLPKKVYYRPTGSR